MNSINFDRLFELIAEGKIVQLVIGGTTVMASPKNAKELIKSCKDMPLMEGNV